MHLFLVGLAQYKYNPVNTFALKLSENDWRWVAIKIKHIFHLYQEPGMKTKRPHSSVVLVPYYVYDKIWDYKNGYILYFKRLFLGSNCPKSFGEDTNKIKTPTCCHALGYYLQKKLFYSP